MTARPTAWVLLRGLTREARHWGDLPGRLQTLAGLPQATRLDLPGNGAWRGLRSPAAIAPLVAFAREQLASQGLAPPFGLVAMSLGGMVATAWAQQHPGEIARLVLINTSMRPFSGAARRLRPRAWPRLAALAACWGDAPRAEALIHGLTCQRRDTLAQDVAAWAAIRRDAPVSAANALRQLAAAARFRAAPGAPACPVLVLSSAADELVSPLCSQAVAQAWQAAHAQHPWAGHDLPHDDPDWLCRTLAGWLAAG
jgi:pimeloyl-ACP methyl ester carboxylesterase